MDDKKLEEEEREKKWRQVIVHIPIKDVLKYVERIKIDQNRMNGYDKLTKKRQQTNAMLILETKTSLKICEWKVVKEVELKTQKESVCTRKRIKKRVRKAECTCE